MFSSIWVCLARVLLRHFRFCVCLYWGFMSRGQNNLWCAHLVAFTCQPSRKVKEGPTNYNSEPNNLMNKVFFSLDHSVWGHGLVDLVGHGHVDLIALTLLALNMLTSLTLTVMALNMLSSARDKNCGDEEKRAKGGESRTTTRTTRKQENKATFRALELSVYGLLVLSLSSKLIAGPSTR